MRRLHLCFSALTVPLALACGVAHAAKSPYPIKHVIFIMQENRSFDSYFGTFPGANGIPAGTCIPLNPNNTGLGCVTPFHDVNDVNAGALHTAVAAQQDLDDGDTTDKDDGYVYQQTNDHGCNTADGNKINCEIEADGVAVHDVMGYHDADELPNYWAYAQNFVLQDQMFASVRSW